MDIIGKQSPIEYNTYERLSIGSQDQVENYIKTISEAVKDYENVHLEAKIVVGVNEPVEGKVEPIPRQNPLIIQFIEEHLERYRIKGVEFLLNSLDLRIEKFFELKLQGEKYGLAPPILDGLDNHRTEITKITQGIAELTGRSFQLPESINYLLKLEKITSDQNIQIQGERGMTELSPEIRAQTISFLFDIGRWAASELKQRWTLARQKKNVQSATEIDLSKPIEESKHQAETLLQDVTAEFGAVKVERVIKLVEQQRTLVFEWEQAKLDYDEEYNRKLIPLAALRRNQEDLNKKIRQAIANIEANLQELSIQVKKETVE